MEQVLLNLTMNARAAMPDGGALTIETVNDGADVMLSVRDEGHGMEPEVVQRAFEPFFTTRPKGQGTGLGLATAYGAVVDARGTIDIESEPGAGTTVRVRLPAAHRQEPAPADVEPQLPKGNGERVLLVEDEDAVRDVVLRLLKRSGYDVRDVGAPLEALDIFVADPRQFDMLLTDVVMPGMSGTQLASRLRDLSPDLPVLFMSGYTAGPAPGGHELPSNGSLLHKPFDREALLTAVHRTLRPSQ
jgi:CheY-like chemotaxis protein